MFLHISTSFLPPLLPLVTPKVHHFTQYNLSESVHYAYSNDITSLDYSTSFKEIMDQFQMKEIVLLCELKMCWSTITNDKSSTHTVLLFELEKIEIVITNDKRIRIYC